MLEAKLKALTKQAVAWYRSLKPLHRAYLITLLVLGFSQGILSVVVLLLDPLPPAGSR